jgi:hypothetical protein
MSYNPEQQTTLEKINGPAPAVDADRLRDDLYQWQRHNDPAINPNSLYRSDPRRYARDEAAQLAVLQKAGVNPNGPTAQQIATGLVQREQAVRPPAELDPGLRAAVDAELARLGNAHSSVRDQAVSDMKAAMGNSGYADLLAGAVKFVGRQLTDSERASHTTLRLYSNMAAFNAKHARR